MSGDNIMIEHESRLKSAILLCFFCHIGVKALSDICLPDGVEMPDEEEMRQVFWRAVYEVGKGND